MPDYPSDVSADDLITELWHNNAKNDGRRHVTKYVVYKKDSIYYAQCSDPTSGNITGNANAATIINSCITADANPVTILLKDDVDADGTVTINKSKVSIVYLGTGFYLTSSTLPRIKKILFDSTDGEINGCSIEGLQIDELDFYANGNDISGIHFWRCKILATATTDQRGIITRGTSSTDAIYFTWCYLYHTDSPANYGFVTIQGTYAGPIFFDHCFYYVDTTETFYRIDSGCRCNMYCVSTYWIVGANATNWKLFDQQGDRGELNVIGGSVEATPSSALLVNIASGTDLRHATQFSDMRISIGAGDTLTLVANANTSWLDEGNKVSINNCHKLGATGTFVVGTTLNVGDRFDVSVRNFSGYTPIRNIASPWDNTNDLLVDSGGTTTLTSGKTYRNVGSTKTIYLYETAPVTVTSIEVNGQTVGVDLDAGGSPVTIHLSAGETFELTYSGGTLVWKVMGN